MSNTDNRSGLLSVTFRKLSTDEILSLAVKAGLGSIEWGGDIHVPPNDLDLARDVGKRTRELGLEISAYGSYYRFDHEAAKNTETGLRFTDVLNTAEALGAPLIRVWAGKLGSDACPPSERDYIVAHTREVAAEAAKRNIKVGFEYHGNTLTDEISSALRFFEDVDHPNVLSFWQPAVGLSREKRLQDLSKVLPILANVHVFHWGPGGGGDRRQLEEGREEWLAYMELIRGAGKSPYYGLEFVREDSPDQLLRDAQVLNTLIQAGR